MPTDPRKRQKKLEKKASKRKEKHALITKEKSAGLAERLESASKSPVLHAGIADSLWETGMGYAFLSRELPNGTVAFASFLIDRYCLGVKDAFGLITGRFDYDSRYLGKLPSYKKARPEAVRKLVEQAVEYARELGFAPSHEYKRVQTIFGDIDATACMDTFEFGKDGKPYFTSGPFDTPARCKAILTTLNDRFGPDGFYFTIGAQLANDILPDGLLERATVKEAD